MSSQASNESQASAAELAARLPGLETNRLPSVPEAPEDHESGGGSLPVTQDVPATQLQEQPAQAVDAVAQVTAGTSQGIGDMVQGLG